MRANQNKYQIILKTIVQPYSGSDTQIAIWRWANVGNGCQSRRQFANIGPTLASQPITWNGWQMVGKWLPSQHCIANLMPTLGQCWKSDHKLTFSQNTWQMVGKGLASLHDIANLMATLGQHCNSGQLLLVPKNGWHMVGNWSDSQHIWYWNWSDVGLTTNDQLCN